MIKEDKIIKPHIIDKKYKTKQIELIKLDKNFTIDDLNKRIEYLKNEVNGDLVHNLLKEITELKLKLSEYEIRDKNRQINILTTPVPIPQIIKPNQMRIQLYDKDTLKLIKTYETIQDAVMEKTLYNDANPQSIHRNIKNNTVYKGYRFYGLERNKEIKEYEIPKTVELSKEQTHQRVVQIKDNKIIDVFGCTKDASESLYKSIQAGSIVLKNQKLKKSTIEQINKSITNCLSVNTNHYGYEYLWYRECDIPENLIDKFEDYKSNNILPGIVIHKNNKQIYKFDNENKLVFTYNSISAALKTEALTEKILKKCIYERNLVNNHYFSYEKDI